MKQTPIQSAPAPRLSLRARLVLANMLITLTAIAGMGYYVYYRARESNNYLSAQLERSTRQQAEDKLTTTADEQAADLNDFFASKSRDIALIGATAGNLLANEGTINTGTYWDASQFMGRMPNGSWDNPNSEDASIFIPASVELTEPLISELNALKLTETTIPPILKANPEIIAVYFGGVQKEVVYYPNIDLASIFPPDFDAAGRPWFIVAQPSANPARSVVWSDPYQDAALHGLVMTGSMPVFDAQDRFRGVAAMDIQLNKITEIVSNIRIGQNGYAFLVDGDNRLIAFPQAAYQDFGVTVEGLPLGEILTKDKLPNTPDEFFNTLAQISSGASGLTSLTLGGTERLIIYRPIPEVGYGLAIIAPTAELEADAIAAAQEIMQQERSTLLVSLVLVIAILLAASTGTLALSNTLTAPLKSLTQAAEELGAGNLGARAQIRTNDEMGILANTFNQMANQLNQTLANLEQRVAERTADLEIARQQSENRARQLQTIGEISSIIAGEQKIENLLPLVTRLVSERFDFYHTGIFLVDETRRWAVLQAANSEGGQKMLARGHRLEVGETGIVGYVTKYGTPRVALDVGTDSVYFDNPDLPATRSEMALPLNVRGRIIGALDVQSTRPGAFTDEDVKTLTILADQIAIAIENARLHGQTQQALAEIQSLYRQDIIRGWASFLESEEVIGYQKKSGESKYLNQSADTSEMREAINLGRTLVIEADEKHSKPALIVPIKLRGQVIGALDIKANSDDRRWSSDEIGLAEAISERLALALENSRLIQESQQSAAKEQTIAEITSRISSSINMRNVLQTAVEELGRALPGSEVIIEFNQRNGNAER